MKQRSDINRNKQEKFFRLAVRNGISLGQAKEMKLDKQVIEYLKKATRNAQVKIYNGYTFIYGKNSKVLYTMYKCPDNITELVKKRSDKNE